MDCSYGDFDTNMCSGGWPSSAMEYIRYRGGLELEADYQYTADLGRWGCKVNASRSVVRVSDVVNITEGDEHALLAAVATVGPVSISFDCLMGMQFYHSGVYDGWFCGTKPTQLTHSVLAVGYGHDAASGKDYWLIKNSWGPKWGMDGYFLMVRGKNKCGLADCGTYPKMQLATVPDTLVV